MEPAQTTIGPTDALEPLVEKIVAVLRLLAGPIAILALAGAAWLALS